MKTYFTLHTNLLIYTEHSAGHPNSLNVRLVSLFSVIIQFVLWNHVTIPVFNKNTVHTNYDHLVLGTLSHSVTAVRRALPLLRV